MWGIHPDYMCKKHIIGEHGEIHKHRHNFVKGHSILGRMYPVVQIDPKNMERRHDQLARYLNHKSPYKQPDLSHYSEDLLSFEIDIEQSRKDLMDRCPKCKELLKNAKIKDIHWLHGIELEDR